METTYFILATIGTILAVALIVIAGIILFCPISKED
jgi:hypothetical protein